MLLSTSDFIFNKSEILLFGKKLPFSTQYQIYMTLIGEALEKSMGEGENDGNLHFLISTISKINLTIWNVLNFSTLKS